MKAAVSSASAQAARARTSSRASTSAPSISSNGRSIVVVARRQRQRRNTFTRSHPNLFLARASEGSGSGSSSESDGEGGGRGRGSSESLEEREARLAALERGVKRKGGAAARSLASQASRTTTGPPRPTGPANWPEGQLFPDGWEDMSVFQKAAELYQGRRGFLFWASQAAWYSAIGVGFGWVLFRFVLPGIGLYKLANGLTDAPTPL